MLLRRLGITGYSIEAEQGIAGFGFLTESEQEKKTVTATCATIPNRRLYTLSPTQQERVSGNGWTRGRAARSR
jgi:hypothetical protein